ncbi:MAG: fibro-slime domain-containing protein [Algisphaera sp.]
MKRFFTSCSLALLAGLGVSGAAFGDYVNGGSLLTPAVSASAETLVLNGVVRDFKTSHPDFESYPYSYNRVLDKLDDYGRPVLDVPFHLSQVAAGTQSVQSAASFSQWFRDDPTGTVSKTLGYRIELEKVAGRPGIYRYAREGLDPFFPIDGKGWGTTPAVEDGAALVWPSLDGLEHNFHFTYELSTLFTYTDPSARDINGNGVLGEAFVDANNPGDGLFLEFTGDDDVFVFINGQLVVDLGGVHEPQAGEVNVDDWADSLGLKSGDTCVLKLFFAERHTGTSNFRMETTILLATEAMASYD